MRYLLLCCLIISGCARSGDSYTISISQVNLDLHDIISILHESVSYEATIETLIYSNDGKFITIWSFVPDPKATNSAKLHVAILNFEYIGYKWKLIKKTIEQN